MKRLMEVNHQYETATGSATNFFSGTEIRQKVKRKYNLEAELVG